MDYKEKYEKALEWMKSIYPTMQGSDKEDAEHYFPELAESEDEKIRKVLIHIVKSACSKYGIKYIGDKITEEMLLAYLEKQKPRDYRELYEEVAKPEWFKENYEGKSLGEEQKPEGCSEDEKMINGLQGFLSAFGSDYFGTDGWQKFDDWLERQKEQKPAEWSDKLDIDTLRDWSMRFAPDIRGTIEATAYYFYNLGSQSSWKHRRRRND